MMFNTNHAAKLTAKKSVKTSFIFASKYCSATKGKAWAQINEMVKPNPPSRVAEVDAAKEQVGF